MSNSLGVDLTTNPHGLGVLAFRGPDAARFLQGQLSADIEKLAAGQSTLAGLHNPQGRVIALLAITRHATDEFFAVLPKDLAAPVEQRLRKYVLRSKLRIEELSGTHTVFGADADTLPIPGGIPVDWGTRQLLLVPADRLSEFATADATALAADLAAWNRADIAEGIPQIYAATSESFVAQMLNLDLLGAIAFDKGCYTGQEVVARAHYRGRVKRRLQRWQVNGAATLSPGDSARAPDGRSLAVVRVASDGKGSQELLAIGAFAPVPASEGGEESTAGTGSPAIQVSGPLPLPYSLPE